MCLSKFGLRTIYYCIYIGYLIINASLCKKHYALLSRPLGRSRNTNDKSMYRNLKRELLVLACWMHFVVGLHLIGADLLGERVYKIANLESLILPLRNYINTDLLIYLIQERFSLALATVFLFLTLKKDFSAVLGALASFVVAYITVVSVNTEKTVMEMPSVDLNVTNSYPEYNYYDVALDYMEPGFEDKLNDTNYNFTIDPDLQEALERRKEAEAKVSESGDTKNKKKCEEMSWLLYIPHVIITLLLEATLGAGELYQGFVCYLMED
jgi:hypothetical protein